MSLLLIFGSVSVRLTLPLICFTQLGSVRFIQCDSVPFSSTNLFRSVPSVSLTLICFARLGSFSLLLICFTRFRSVRLSLPLICLTFHSARLRSFQCDSVPFSSTNLFHSVPSVSLALICFARLGSFSLLLANLFRSVPFRSSLSHSH